MVYDDGDEEWVDLAADKIKLHAEDGESHPNLEPKPFVCCDCMVRALVDAYMSECRYLNMTGRW